MFVYYTLKQQYSGKTLIFDAIANKPKPFVIENDDHFELLPGQMVDLQLNHPTLVRLKTRLVGYEVGKYIILKHPDPAGDNSHRDVLTEGNVAIVRYILEGDKGECCAFKSPIIHLSQYPERFIFLAFPEQIQNRQLRLHQRISTHIPAEITMKCDNTQGQHGLLINGIVIDISERGCGFVFRAQNLTVNVKKRDIYLVIRNAAGEPVKIPARVCNSRNESCRVSVGIQFIDAAEQVNELLEQLFIAQDLK